MDLATVVSKNGIIIRLTQERWKHIILMHPSLVDKQNKVLGTVKNPDYILKGAAKELLAVSAISKRGYLVVVYKETLLLRNKETVKDGFIITAYQTTDTLWLFKKEILWSKRS